MKAEFATTAALGPHRYALGTSLGGLRTPVKHPRANSGGPTYCSETKNNVHHEADRLMFRQRVARRDRRGSSNSTLMSAPKAVAIRSKTAIEGLRFPPSTPLR
jgi:hypothetical protein